MEKWRGFCPVCRKETEFVSSGSWYRDTLTCTSCPSGSSPRERALALVLDELRPTWRDLHIHESSPAPTGISLLMQQEAKHYVGSQYLPDQTFGETLNGVRNENLQALTFPDDTHDIFVSLDVFEHLPQPRMAVQEIYRTLKPGGLMISTFPVRKWQVEALERRVDYDADGREIHLKEPEYHGNPVDPEGSIVTVDYGYDIHQALSAWVPFDVRVYRFSDRRHGIVGEYTDLFACFKH